MNTKVLLILILTIAWSAAEFNCSNHPMQSPKNRFNISGDNWLDVPATAGDDLPFCKGMQGKQTCCKNSGFEELQKKYFDHLNEFKDERKRLEKRFDDLRTDVFVTNIDKVLTLQARGAVVTRKLISNLNGIFFRIKSLFKHIRDWDDHDDDHDDRDDKRFLSKLSTLQISEKYIQKSIEIADQVKGSFRMLQRAINDTDISPTDPRGIPDDKLGPEFESWKDIKYDFPGISWNLDVKKAAKQGLSLWNFTKHYNVKLDGDDLDDWIEDLLEDPKNVSDLPKIDEDKNVKEGKRQLKNVTKIGFKIIQEVKNRAFNYQKQCMEDMFNIQASMSCQVCNAEIGKIAKRNTSRTDKKIIDFKYKGRARLKQNTNCYKYYFYYYQLGWVQKSMIEQKVLFNTTGELFAMMNRLSDHVKDQLSEYDNDMKDMKLLDKASKLLDIGYKSADMVNATVHSLRKWANETHDQYVSHEPWKYYFHQKPFFNNGNKMVFIPNPFQGMNKTKFFFQDLKPTDDPKSWKEKDTVWGYIMCRADFKKVERYISSYKKQVDYYRKLIDFTNRTDPFDPTKPDKNDTDRNDTNDTRDDDVKLRYLTTVAADEDTDWEMVESDDADAVDLGEDGNNLSDEQLDVKQSNQQFDQLDQAEKNIDVDNTSLKAITASSWWKWVLGIIVVLIIIGVAVYFGRNKISTVIQGDFHVSEITNESQLVTMNSFDKFETEDNAQL